MSDTLDTTLDDCGCCDTEPAETPIFNPPGQPQLAYRIDTQPTFLRRMLAALTHQTVPPDSLEDDARRPLAALSTRSLDDPSVALLDAWATVADVLTFYQERIANEGYLRTAIERRSVLELAREIGYELPPGVAASADLAFTVEDAVGAPRQTPVGVGTKVLSVPGPGETPQTFETVEAIVARPEWNAFPPRRDDPEEILPGLTDLFLAGIDTQLQVGDAILMVGTDRAGNEASPNWDVRLLTAVEPDPPNRRTRVVWADGINTTQTPGEGATSTRVFAFRKRAQLFGHNAPQFRLLSKENKLSFVAGANNGTFPTGLNIDTVDDWDHSSLAALGFTVANTGFVDLDMSGPKLLPGSWIAIGPTGGIGQPTVPEDTASEFPPAKLRPAPFPLALGEDVPADPTTVPVPAGTTLEGALFQVAQGPFIGTKSGFSTSGTVTSLGVDNRAKLAGNLRRALTFYVESQELRLGTRPVTVPVDGREEIPEIPDSSKTTFTGPTGNFLAVGLAVQGLRPGQKLALVGKRPNLLVVDPNTLAIRTKAYVERRSLLEGFALSADNMAPVIASVQALLQPPPADSPESLGGLILDDPPGAREPLAGHTFELLEQLEDGKALNFSGENQQHYDFDFDIPTKVWRLRSRTGAVGTATLPFFAVDVVAPAPDGEVISEIRRIDAVFQGASRMLLELDAPLQFIYDRGSLVLSANVAAATHGETILNETLGNGDPAVPNQTFTLRKPPLTFVSSPESPTGALSTLDIRVNNILWREVPRLFGLGPDEQAYILRRNDDGQTDVIFGDGIQGSRLPSGTANVVATYRTGIGPAGQVAARTLSLLSTRPLGVRAVVNPLAATGAAPPAVIDDAKQNAPLAVRTIDRVVSVADVEDFARSFAGIGKAQARLLWSGHTQLVHLTVGGADGRQIPPKSPVLEHLATALELHGDPSLLLGKPIDTFDEHRFRLTIQLEIDDRFETARVQADVRAALLDAFSFARRDFGQPVNEAEILAVAQGVAGVVASNVSLLADELDGVDSDELVVQVARFDDPDGDGEGQILPAGLLIINPDHLSIQDLVVQ